MSEIYITSDQHVYHKNIATYCPDSRPFSSVEEMNEAIIERHNEVVSPKDQIYYLGDFSFGTFEQTEAILKRLNGHKYYVFGNHCKVMKNNGMHKHFKWMKDYAEIKVDKKHIVLFHFPILQWNRKHYSSYHFHGHRHSNEKADYCRDIGVDGNNLYPYNIRELIGKESEGKE